MSARPHGRLLKAAALVPLAAASVAWTVSVAGLGGPALVLADRAQPPAALPDGSTVPTQAIEAPASVTGDEGSLSTGAGASTILATASTSAIPSAALAAYQRAETVINTADPSCRLPWQLVAAIGRVESNHGRANGNVLGDDGFARPGIYGVPLDGTAQTQLISDTDAGQYDQDTTVDRAVGPMQFIPSTWAVVGVDADNDGRRDPQDINDAALASAVYLCSGDDDLSTPDGQQAAVFRYNHSQSYVDLVLSVMRSYLAGDFTSVPNYTYAAGTLVPISGAGADTGKTVKAGKSAKAGKSSKSGSSKQSTGSSTGGTSATPAAEPTTSAPEPTKAASGGTGGVGGNDGGDKVGPKVPAGSGKGITVTMPGGGTATVPALPSTSASPVDAVLTQAQAIAQCTLEGQIDNPTADDDAFDTCVKDYTTKN